MVHALAGVHDVATLTAGPWSTAETNTYYGTSIPARAVKTHVIGFPWRMLSPLREDRVTRLRMSALLRRARELAPQYDLLITADNYAPFREPGIQYVHFPAKLQPPPARLDALVDRYYALCTRVLGAPWTDSTRNLTLANSRWTADGIERLGELPRPVVLYPPVIDPGAGLPWAERDNTFLCIGRFTWSKRVELAISIVKAVRHTSMRDARLVIVGSHVETDYASQLRRLAAGEAWIEFREDLSRDAVNALMGRSRYGIQAMVGEHFGMATAEMARAGCLVFAHRSGGTPEVLNDEGALLWASESEAIERIGAIESVDAHPLSARLRAHASQFSTEAFVGRFRKIVDGVR